MYLRIEINKVNSFLLLQQEQKIIRALLVSQKTKDKNTVRPR